LISHVIPALRKTHSLSADMQLQNLLLIRIKRIVYKKNVTD